MADDLMVLSVVCVFCIAMVCKYSSAARRISRNLVKANMEDRDFPPEKEINSALTKFTGKDMTPIYKEFV